MVNYEYNKIQRALAKQSSTLLRPPVSRSDAGRDSKEEGIVIKPQLQLREVNLLYAEGGRAALQSHRWSPSLCIGGRARQ